MKILITGISGTLARGVAYRLTRRGYRVIGIDRRPWPDVPEGVEMPELAHGPENDQGIVSIHVIKAVPIEEEELEAAAAEGEAEGREAEPAGEPGAESGGPGPDRLLPPPAGCRPGRRAIFS